MAEQPQALSTGQIIAALRQGVTQGRKVFVGAEIDPTTGSVSANFTGLGLSGSFVVENPERLTAKELQQVGCAYATGRVPFSERTIYAIGKAGTYWKRQVRQTGK